MTALLELFVLLVGMFWAIVTTIGGILFIPIILILAVLTRGKPPVSKSTSIDTSTLHITSPPKSEDHYVEATIDYVPPEYYEAYSQYLKKSPEWRKLRKQRLKLDNYICVDCGIKGFNANYNPTGPILQVHHLHYNGIDTMTFTVDQLVSVCPTCHDKRHGRI